MEEVGEIPTKKCCRCKDTKDTADFHKDRTTKDGLCAKCKICANKNASECRSRKSPSTRYAYRREEHLRNKYGITSEDYDRMLENQGGLCAICNKVPDRTVIDHDHNTGKVRGLLCNKCNTGIGLLGDTVEGVSNALDYLKQIELYSKEVV